MMPLTWEKAWQKTQPYVRIQQRNNVALEVFILWAAWRRQHSADVITIEMERKLGILGMSTPQALLNAVFFYNGKSLSLRGVREQLGPSF